MDGNQEEVVLEESKVQESISTEKCEGLDSKLLPDVKLTSAAPDSHSDHTSMDSTTDMKLKDAGDVEESNTTSPKLFETKADVGFKLPQLPQTFPGKISRPKIAAGNAHKNLDVKNQQAVDSQLAKHTDLQNNEGPSSTKSEQVKSCVNQSRLDEDITNKSKSSDDENKKEVFTAPSLLLPKRNRLQQQEAKSKDTNVISSTSDEEKQRLPDTAEFENSKSETSSSSNYLKERNQAVSKLSPAEKRAQAVPIPYKEPSWSGVPKQSYYLEVLKGGTILSKILLNEKPYLVFGRLESCDVMLEHPSLSRFHMVLQYRQVGDSDNDPGFYVYDLDSTHGSFLNKRKLKPKTYCRMHVGHMFKLAGSTRLYILQVCMNCLLSRDIQWFQLHSILLWNELSFDFISFQVCVIVMHDYNLYSRPRCVSYQLDFLWIKVPYKAVAQKVK